MKKPKQGAISVRESTYKRLQAYAKSKNKTVAQVVESWIRQHAPFTEKRPSKKLKIIDGGGYREF